VKVLQRWPEYYKKHLQDGTHSDTAEEWTMWVQTEEPYVAVGTYM